MEQTNNDCRSQILISTNSLRQQHLVVGRLRFKTEVCTCSQFPWKLVGTGRQERKDQWKREGVHTKEQHYVTQAVNSPDAYANERN